MRRFDRSLVFGLAAIVWLFAGLAVVTRPAVDKTVTPRAIDKNAIKADMRAVYL